MINLFDWFDQKAQDLYYSLIVSGYDHPSVVIHDDGFLPEEVLSPIRFFGNWDKEDTGTPKFFNQIEVPRYYRISGSNTQAAIHNQNKKIANIYYAPPTHRRLVKAVDWLDERGVVRLTEHYNQYGWRYAQTNLNRDQQAVLRTYFDKAGREILVENFSTGDITLNWKGELKMFKKQSDFLKFYFKEAGLDVSSIWYNSLSVPFLTSHYLGGDGNDILFWQEGAKNEVPGNMQLILQGGSPRTKKIIVQDVNAYKTLINQVPDEQKGKLAYLGFIYPSLNNNHHGKESLILTNSDRLEGLQQLVDSLPDIHFHIGALTEMSMKLMNFAKYDNVTLYPNISAQLIESLFDRCDIYLDINHESEIVSALRRAFEHDQLIFAFNNTAHAPQFVANQNMFAPEDVQGLVAALKALPENFEAGLDIQRQESDGSSPEDYQAMLG